MMLMGAWILLLHLRITQAGEAALSVTPARLVVNTGGAAELNCNKKALGTPQFSWYKERQDGGLVHVPSSLTQPPAARGISSSLVLNNLQRSHSGAYYCAQNPLVNPILSTGTKLFVTDTAPTPTLSILVPSEEDSQLPEKIVLLCVVSGITDEWGPVTWRIDSREFHGQTDTGSFDSQGVFSIRSLLVISGDSWRQGKTCSCSTTNNSTGQLFTTTITRASDTNYGACSYVLFFGLPICLVLLLVQLALLIVCKERLRGTKKPRVRMEMTETVYASTK